MKNLDHWEVPGNMTSKEIKAEIKRMKKEYEARMEELRLEYEHMSWASRLRALR